MKAKIIITKEKLFDSKISDIDITGLTGGRDYFTGDILITLEDGEEIVYSGHHGVDDFLEFGFKLGVDYSDAIHEFEY